MKLAVLLVGLLACLDVSAQQKTWGDIISENYMKGRQMRQASDEQNRAAEQELRDEEERRRKFDQSRLQRQMEAAYKNPSLVLESKKELPDILVSDLPANNCTSSLKAVFTTDANGKIIPGCASLGASKAYIVWVGYGSREYDLSDWYSREPIDPDDAPLGEY